MWKTDAIGKIKIKLASPEEIRGWSHGEVKKTDTINYRTFRPERGGLFCEQIFGPSKSYECYCGKYRKMKYKGVKCERCGVEVTSSRVRRERMGHIELAAPIVHIWYTKKYLPLFLGMRRNDVEKIVYFASYVVIDSGNTSLKPMQLVEEEEYQALREKYGEDAFEVGTGAEAILRILTNLKLDFLKERLKEKLLQGGPKGEKVKLIKRLEVVESFLRSGNKPEWMILKLLPVIPPDFRPMVQLESGIFANSDLNDLYRRIINRNNRLKYLLEIGAPQIIIQNEKKMLQQSVDALFENEKLSQPILGAGGRPLKSLGEIIKGKQGRFRQNLLGKRVDYSGRAVIVPGPELKLNECGLPEKVALELYRPFVLGEILREGKAETIKRANDLIEKADPFVWETLEKVVKDHPLLLNRAPTLHRLGIQAFQPLLVEGAAIHLHPLVCASFNADFDGDQMAVHIPLSTEAQLEAMLLMSPPNNLISPAHGEPVVTPSQDITLGCYYLTLVIDENEKPVRAFSSPEEVLLAYDMGKVELHGKIKVLMNKMWLETSPGRVIFNQVLPRGTEFQNRTFDKSALSQLIIRIWKDYGDRETVLVLDEIKKLGFKFATKSGLTFSLADIPVVKEKAKLLEDIEDEAAGYKMLAEEGAITSEERYIDVIDLVARVTEQIGEKVLQYVSRDKLNPLYMMWHSGARGSANQLSQIGGMRGLMSRSIRETYRRELWEEAFRRDLPIPTDVIRQYFYPAPGGKLVGRIGEEPIRSSFKEGLSAPEYFISTTGGRKGLIDTALKTAYAGYLTRKLVAVAQNVIVTGEDCGTVDGFEMEALIQEGQEIEPLDERIVGRVTAVPVMNPETGEEMMGANQVINDEVARKIQKSGIKKVRVRSPLTCQANLGICQKCYGWDLSIHRIVSLGEAVGVIAAQSIGEPGTQLTLRTFHTGGIFRRGGDIPQGLPRATELFEPRKQSYSKKGKIHQRKGEEALISEIEGKVFLEEREGHSLVKVKGEDEREVLYEVDGEILVSEGDTVEAGEKIIEGAVNPRVLLNVIGVRAVQKYLVNQTQFVYRAQGVKINVKHFEVIIRQMMRKVEVEEPGDTGYLPGEQVDRIEFEEVNRKIKEQGGKPATVKPILLAIPKAAQEDKDSFLSAASFQRTKQVLADAAIKGQVDNLWGLKANVILGRLIPAGTGFRGRLDEYNNLKNET
ncbi:DNA-directed RNA polymerase subunit beta' [Candidatus Aerophobetes bacterium]|nr:DNA-directed RNA polymerase subunit beta' [Candidatus Aerophobetes bacterium]